MRNRTITVTGPFSDTEFAEVVALMRAIDQRHPGELFILAVDDPVSTMDEAEQALASAFSADPDRITIVKRFPNHGMPGSPGNVGC